MSAGSINIVPIFPNSLIEPLVVHKFPDSPHPGVTTRSRCRRVLKTMPASDQRVKIGLDAHAAELLPAFHRTHRRVNIRIAVDQ